MQTLPLERPAPKISHRGQQNHRAPIEASGGDQPRAVLSFRLRQSRCSFWKVSPIKP